MVGTSRQYVNILLGNIDYDVTFTVNLATYEVVLQGSHDGFPSYIMGAGAGKYNFTEKTADLLMDPLDITVMKRWSAY